MAETAISGQVLQGHDPLSIRMSSLYSFRNIITITVDILKRVLLGGGGACL